MTSRSLEPARAPSDSRKPTCRPRRHFHCPEAGPTSSARECCTRSPLRRRQEPATLAGLRRRTGAHRPRKVCQTSTKRGDIARNCGLSWHPGGARNSLDHFIGPSRHAPARLQRARPASCSRRGERRWCPAPRRREDHLDAGQGRSVAPPRAGAPVAGNFCPPVHPRGATARTALESYPSPSGVANPLASVSSG